MWILLQGQIPATELNLLRKVLNEITIYNFVKNINTAISNVNNDQLYHYAGIVRVAMQKRLYEDFVTNYFDDEKRNDSSIWRRY